MPVALEILIPKRMNHFNKKRTPEVYRFQQIKKTQG